MPLAMVLGVNGQDGIFLSRRLIARGYHVVGVARQKTSRDAQSNDLCAYEKLDLRDGEELKSALQKYKPDLIFHVAAVHGSAGTQYELIWQEMVAVNLASVHVVLEYLRNNKRSGSLVYANSGKIFGPRYPKRITERSRTRGSCLYTITKIGARDLIRYYRDVHGVKGSSLFLFNHESELRQGNFVMPKILGILAKSLDDSAYQESVETLNFFCDWGDAEEYMDISIDIAEQFVGDDYIIGTGKTWNARTFVRLLFADYGLDYRHHVKERGGEVKEHTSIQYSLQVSKLLSSIGRKPEVGILDLSRAILHRKFGVQRKSFK